MSVILLGQNGILHLKRVTIFQLRGRKTGRPSTFPSGDAELKAQDSDADLRSARRRVQADQ